jgi:hypothetical protein
LFLPFPLGAQATRQARPPIIDMHMHAFRVMAGPDGKPLPVPCAPQPCQSTPALATSDDSVFRLTVEAMDRYNIVKGFLSSDNLPNLYRWVEAAPSRFLPSPFIWRPGEPSIQELRREYAAGRLVAMGEIGTQYNGLSPADTALEPYFALAEELDVPVHIHTLGFGAPLPGFRSAAGNPLLLEGVLVRHPRLRLFVEDAGYPFLPEMIAMMYQYPQLYADLATISWIIPRDAFHDYLRALVRAGLGKRIMFGSDQMQWPEAIGRAIDGIESATFLTAAQKRDIFYNNAARFLRLAPSPAATR